MKKIIYKKFNSDVTTFLLLSGLSIALIVWTLQAVNYLDIISEDGHSFKVYFLFTSLNFPKIFIKILPFIFLISLFQTISKYESENQLMIYWHHGIDKIKLIHNIFNLSIIFFVIQIIFSLFIVPYTQDKSRSFIRTSGIDYFPNLIKERKFIDTVSNLTIYVDQVENKNIYKNIVLKDQINDEKAQIIYAKFGKLIKEDTNFYLSLEDGEILNINKNKIHRFNFKNTTFNISKFSTKTTTYPKVQERATFLLIKCLQSLNNISISEINFMNCDKKSEKAIKQELFKRSVSPLFIPIIALIISMMIFKDKNNKSYKSFKIMIFLISIIILFISEVLIRFVGITKNIDFAILALPIFFLIASYLIIRKYVN